MKAVVFASHYLGAACIEALHENGFEIMRVYVPKDEPFSEISLDPVKGVCRNKNLEIQSAGSEADENLERQAAELGVEVIFCFHYPYPLPARLVAMPDKGAVAIYASLLPVHHGRFPVNQAIINGEHETGITICYLTPEPLVIEEIARERVWIEKDDTAKTLHQRLARTAARTLSGIIPAIGESSADRKTLELTAQCDGDGLDREGAHINWLGSSWDVYNLVRAMTRPFPGAFTGLMGQRIVIWWAEPDDSNVGILYPGEIEIEDEKVLAGARFGAVRIEEIEWQGKVLKGAGIAEALAPHWRERLK